MNSITEEELKTICVKILAEINKICMENNLTYFSNLGTLIGAVRHKGFIPWDDDVDVCMPREDYEKFLDIAEKNSKFSIIHDHNHKNYYFSFARLCDPSTILKIKGITEIENMGVFVDIFPLDYVPDDKEERLSFFAEVKELDEMVNISTPERLKTTISIRNRLRKMKKIKRTIKAKLIGFDKLVVKRKKIMSRYLKRTKTLSCMCPPDDRMTFSSEIYDGTVSMPFETITVQAPANYDVILRKYYGDYMQLPPEDQRVSAHHFKAFYLNETNCAKPHYCGRW